MTEYPVFDISEYDPDQFEQLGTKSKFWYEDKDGNSFLFKSVKTYDKHGRQVERSGEDWAEKIASQLALFLSIPHANYELAVHRGETGVITENFILGRRGERLITGNELIDKVVKNELLVVDGQTQKVNRVYIAVKNLISKKPIGFKSINGLKNAVDYFVGYLMLDALISNQDRHSENWGMIVTVNGTSHLAVSFDHGASLGRNESDERRQQILSNAPGGFTVEKYVLRAKSHFYHANAKLKTLDAFMHFAKWNTNAALIWINQLKMLNDDDIWAIIDKVPENRMSEMSKRFTYEVIRCNKINILRLEEEINKVHFVI